MAIAEVNQVEQRAPWQEIANDLYPDLASGFLSEEQAIGVFYDALALDIVRANIKSYLQVTGRTAEVNGVVTHADLDVGYEGLILITAKSAAENAHTSDTEADTEDRLRLMIEMKQSLLDVEERKKVEKAHAAERKAGMQRVDDESILRQAEAITIRNGALAVRATE